MRKPVLITLLIFGATILFSISVETVMGLVCTYEVCTLTYTTICQCCSPCFSSETCIGGNCYDCDTESETCPSGGNFCSGSNKCKRYNYYYDCGSSGCNYNSFYTTDNSCTSKCDSGQCSGGSCKTSTPAPTPTPTPVPAPTPCVPGASESCSSSCTPGCNGCVRSYDSCGQDEDIVVCCLYGCTGSSCDEPECTSPWTGSACTTSGCYDGHEYKSCTNNAYGNQYCKADIPYNYQCSGSTPECSSGTCVECAYNSHCGQGKYCTSSNTCSSCATQPGTCQQWKYSYGCTIEADPNCCTSDDTKPSSVSCLTDTCYVGTWQDKCVSNSWEQDWCKATRTSDGKYTQECDTSTQYCRDDGKTGSCNPITCSDNPSGCNSFLDCSLGTTVHCDAECSSGTSSGGKCANCDVDGDGVLSSSCGGNDCNDNQEAIGACSGSIPFCESVPSGPSPKCVECLDNDDCTTSSKPVCDTSTYTCVECAGDGDCTDSAKSVCDTSTNTCVACKDGDASTCGTNGCWLSGNPEGSFWPSAAAYTCTSSNTCVLSSLSCDTDCCDTFDGCYDGYYKNFYCWGSYCRPDRTCTASCCGPYQRESWEGEVDNPEIYEGYCDSNKCVSPAPSIDDVSISTGIMGMARGKWNKITVTTSDEEGDLHVNNNVYITWIGVLDQIDNKWLAGFRWSRELGDREDAYCSSPTGRHKNPCYESKAWREVMPDSTWPIQVHIVVNALDDVPHYAQPQNLIVPVTVYEPDCINDNQCSTGEYCGYDYLCHSCGSAPTCQYWESRGGCSTDDDPRGTSCGGNYCNGAGSCSCSAVPNTNLCEQWASSSGCSITNSPAGTSCNTGGAASEICDSNGNCVACNDVDDDGYGSPGNAACTNGAATDCVDSGSVDGVNAVDINPGKPDVCDGVNLAGGGNDCNDATADGSGETTPACAKTLGVCAGSVKACGGVDGWLDCTATSYGTNYEETETRCSDTLNNDCDANGADCADPDCAGKTGPSESICCQPTSGTDPTPKDNACNALTTGSCGEYSCTTSNQCDVVKDTTLCSATKGTCGNFLGTCSGTGPFTCNYLGINDDCACDQKCGDGFNCEALSCPEPNILDYCDESTGLTCHTNPVSCTEQYAGFNNCVCHGCSTCPGISTGASTGIGGAICS